VNSGGEELRELCQQISNEVDSEDFEPLVSKLNQVLDQMGANKPKPTGTAEKKERIGKRKSGA
jgi:hypothetical protein